MPKKRLRTAFFLTAVVVVFLSVYIGYTIRFVNDQTTQYCFDTLETTAQNLANEFYQVIDSDSAMLSAMAEIIASRDENDHDGLCAVLNAYHASGSYLSYVELLYPDNTILDSSGAVRGVSGLMDFAQEAGKGAYISKISQSTRDPAEKVIRNCVPVVRDGKTALILFGTARLSDLAEKYSTTIYDGNAYVYLEDGDTGDFLLDTWHKSLGNIKDVSNRTMVPGYSFEKAIDDMRHGRSGRLGFVSTTTNRVLYVHYAPVGINNWNVLLSVEDTYALSQNASINKRLYLMAAVVGIAMLVYSGFVCVWLYQSKRQLQKLALEDLTTGLFNRNAYEKYVAAHEGKTLASIHCVYIDVNGLHETNNQYGHEAGDRMLQAVTQALQSQFAYETIYRIGGDEFVVYGENSGTQDIQQKMERVAQQLMAGGVTISYGIARQENAAGVKTVTKEADARMLDSKRLYYQHNDRRSRAHPPSPQERDANML